MVNVWPSKQLPVATNFMRQLPVPQHHTCMWRSSEANGTLCIRCSSGSGACCTRARWSAAVAARCAAMLADLSCSTPPRTSTIPAFDVAQHKATQLWSMRRELVPCGMRHFRPCSCTMQKASCAGKDQQHECGSHTLQVLQLSPGLQHPQLRRQLALYPCCLDG